MIKRIIINIHGFDIAVILTNASKMASISHYTYGQIYLSCPFSTSIDKIKISLEKRFSYRLLAKFDHELLFTDSYCYILGEKRRRVKPFSYLEITKNDFFAKDDEELFDKLKKLAYDILLSRVRKYETIMNTKKHDIKITAMSAARGKNYYKKSLLTFAYELVHFSLELIDAIVIHELAHDFYQDHSSNFYNVVYKFCPDYNKRIEKLNYGVKK